VHLHNTAVHDLSVYDGISLRVKGDGKQYKLILKTDPELNGFSYHFPFVTKKDAWITVYAPFREFIPRFRGAVLSDVPPLNPAEIKSFGIMISDKQEGQFHLALESIKAYAL